MDSMKRFGMKLTPELHGYYKEKSERIGVPMTTLVLLDLEKLSEQRQTQNMMAVMEAAIKMINAGDGAKIDAAMQTNVQQ